ncbi:MAG: sigma 54-interacting transcriptional regulator [Candidatus Marinimicrobia bacterium]|nr:sigma 54-interacting transcriptional regulator [Candidatus Neomarinimicrobiota bacterium]
MKKNPTARKSGDDRASRKLNVLFRISQAITHQHVIPALLDEVLSVFETEMDLRRGTFTLRRGDSDIFAIEASRGLSAAERRLGEYRAGEGITGRVAASGQPTLVADVSQDPNFLNRTRSRRESGIAFLCAPIRHEGKTIGTLSIDRVGGDETELRQDLEFLMLVADLLADAVAGIRAQIEERQGLLAENERLRRELGDRFRPDNMIGNCGSMRAVYDQIAQVAAHSATVLIRGESGTGKELVARALHYSSPRRNLPFIAVNCAALPEHLVESELFGHEKGAFTGAVQQRKGRFELAHGGTLFLDEIGDISAAVQVRLLRVLQEREFERVGGAATVKVNVRVVAATSTDLEKALREGRFREDLFYRLNVFPILLPPLRERGSDVLLLADYFVAQYSRQYERPIKRISTTAINMMTAYHWPGNVRELENCIERAVLTSTDGVLHGYTLPPTLQTAEQTQTALLRPESGSLRDMVDAYEREIITDALKQARGNAAAAARLLHTTQRILNYRIGKLRLDPQQFRHYEKTASGGSR